MPQRATTQEPLIGIAFQQSKDEAVLYTKRPTIRQDKQGVLQYKIPYTTQWEYYPIFMARYAIGYLELYEETCDEQHKNIFLTQVNWLEKHLKNKGSFSVWEHHYTLPFFSFQTPWVHGLGQGLGMVALLKAYQLTNEKHYLESATQVFNSFLVDIKDGGVQYTDEKGYLWLEEYALLPPPHVLNGFITILFAINEFYQVTKNKQAHNLWKKGITTVKTYLAQYDRGYWSLYDLQRKYPSTKSYHNLHIRQLKILYHLTGDSFFSEYEQKWSQYTTKTMNIKRASIKRGIVHLKRYGILNCIQRYFQRKRWEQTTPDEGKNP